MSARSLGTSDEGGLRLPGSIAFQGHWPGFAFQISSPFQLTARRVDLTVGRNTTVCPCESLSQRCKKETFNRISRVNRACNCFEQAGPGLIESFLTGIVLSTRVFRFEDRDIELGRSLLVKLTKTLNNNVAVAQDNNGCEFVVIGLGVGYVERGAEIPQEKVERVFSSVEQQSQLYQLVESIPQRYFDLAREIVDYAQSTLSVRLADSIYIALTDHIAYVHERAQKGLLPKNSLTWEISQYYRREFEVGKKVVELLEDELDGTSALLGDAEAASIALHLINAEQEEAGSRQGIEELKLMNQVMQIIRYQAHLVYSEGDLDYQRLVVHVRFFVQRVLGGERSQVPGALSKMVRESYPEAYSVAEHVRAFVEGKLARSIGDEEITYLIIHIARLLNRA